MEKVFLLFVKMIRNVLVELLSSGKGRLYNAFATSARRVSIYIKKEKKRIRTDDKYSTGINFHILFVKMDKIEN